MRTPVAVLSLAMTMTLVTGAAAKGATQDPHVRPANQQGAALMADAQQRSQTVRGLMAKLDQSDLVAYVETAPRVLGEPESSLRFVGSSKVQRFVMVRISSNIPADRQVELLGHELQHATEVVGASWVKDGDALRTLFTRIGWRDMEQQRGYETSAASQIGRQVRRELTANGQ